MPRRKRSPAGVAEELEHLAPFGVNGGHDKVENPIQHLKDLLARQAVRQGCKAAQIGDKDDRLNVLAATAPDPALEHLRPCLSTDIGVEQGRHHEPRRMHLEDQRQDWCKLEKARNLVFTEATFTIRGEGDCLMPPRRKGQWHGQVVGRALLLQFPEQDHS
jgi:hypothetical protein